MKGKYKSLREWRQNKGNKVRSGMEEFVLEKTEMNLVSEGILKVIELLGAANKSLMPLTTATSIHHPVTKSHSASRSVCFLFSLNT